MANEKVDQYAQIAYLDVSTGATGSLAFNLLQIAQFALEAPKLGLKIIRAEFDTYDFIAKCLAHAGAATIDTLTFGLSVSNLITSITQQKPEVIYAGSRTCYFGTNVGVNFEMDPVQRMDFSTFPGGGILIPADRLYMCASSDNVGAAVKTTCRLWYTVVALDAQGYLELIEQRSIMSV